MNRQLGYALFGGVVVLAAGIVWAYPPPVQDWAEREATITCVKPETTGHKLHMEKDETFKVFKGLDKEGRQKWMFKGLKGQSWSDYKWDKMNVAAYLDCGHIMTPEERDTEFACSAQPLPIKNKRAPLTATCTVPAEVCTEDQPWSRFIGSVTHDKHPNPGDKQLHCVNIYPVWDEKKGTRHLVIDVDHKEGGGSHDGHVHSDL